MPDSTRTARLPDPDRKWAALGAHWKLSDSISLDAAYAHLFSSRVPLRQNAGNTSASGFLIGEQSSDIDIASIQVNVGF